MKWYTNAFMIKKTDGPMIERIASSIPTVSFFYSVRLPCLLANKVDYLSRVRGTAVNLKRVFQLQPRDLIFKIRLSVCHGIPQITVGLQPASVTYKRHFAGRVRASEGGH